MNNSSIRVGSRGRSACAAKAPLIEALESRVMLSATPTGWRAASGLSHTTGKIPFGIGGAGITAVSVGNLALFTGVARGRATDKVAIYDATTGTWGQSRLIPVRSGGAAVGVGDLALFAHASRDPEGVLFDPLDVYNVTTREATITQLSAFDARIVGTAIDGKAVFSNGDVYDPATGDVSATLPPEAGRLQVPGAATSVDHLALFAGGQIFGAGTSRVVKTVHIYDALTGVWSTAELSHEREGLAATAVGDMALFAGGYDSEGFSTDIVDIYDAGTGQWSVAYLSSARSFIAATTVGNLAIFSPSAGSERVADVYDAATGKWFATKMAGHSSVAATSADDTAFIAGRGSTLDVFTLVPAVVGSISGKAGGTVKVTVQSTGDVVPPAGATISLYAATGTTLDGSAVLLGQTTLPRQLAPGGSLTLNVATSVPRTLGGGRYHLIAALDDGDGQGPLVIAAQAKSFTVKRQRRSGGAVAAYVRPEVARARVWPFAGVGVGKKVWEE